MLAVYHVIDTMTVNPKQKKAAIDIGTNSIILCIAESSNNPEGYVVIHDEIILTRLGEGLSESKELGSLPSNRSIQAIQHFVTIAREMGVSETKAVGTAVLRKALNADFFCKRVKDTCGIDIEIISGEQEAQLAHSAVAIIVNGRDCIIFDIGGGSIEFIYSRNNEISSKFSLNFGVLNIKEKYFLHESEKNEENDFTNKACLGIKTLFNEASLVIPKSDFLLVGIGGTVVTMASVKLKLPEFLPNKVNRTVLDISEVSSQILQYQNSTLDERAKIPGLSADRADIILAGACIVKTLMDQLSADSLIVSTNGLRHAVLSEMFLIR